MADHSYYGWFIDFSFCCCCRSPLRVRSSIEEENQHKSGLFLFDHDFDKNVLQDHFLQFSGLKLVHIVFYLNRTMCVRIPIVIVIVCIVLVITRCSSLSCTICCLLTNDVLCWHGHCMCAKRSDAKITRLHTPHTHRTLTSYTCHSAVHADLCKMDNFRRNLMKHEKVYHYIRECNKTWWQTKTVGIHSNL